MARGPLGAVSFLTVVPVPVDRFCFAEAAPWFPVVGAAVGGVAGGLDGAFEPLLGHAPAAVLATLGLAGVTGALHVDGLADTADGLGVRGDRNRRLAAMRDPVVGSFGVVAIVGWALLLVSGLAGLSRAHAVLALVVAGACSRLTPLVQAVLAPPARRDGLGARFAVDGLTLAVALGWAALTSVLGAGPARGGLALGAGLLMAAATALIARRTLGGSTGDTLGASVCVSEVAVVLALLASWR